MIKSKKKIKKYQIDYLNNYWFPVKETTSEKRDRLISEILNNE